MQTETEPRIPTYGFRVDRCGDVYAFTQRPVRGRCPERHQLYVGTVSRANGGWKTDAACNVYPTQADAALNLIWMICGGRQPGTW